MAGNARASLTGFRSSATAPSAAGFTSTVPRASGGSESTTLSTAAGELHPAEFNMASHKAIEAQGRSSFLGSVAVIFCFSRRPVARPSVTRRETLRDLTPFARHPTTGEAVLYHPLNAKTNPSEVRSVSEFQQELRQ